MESHDTVAPLNESPAKTFSHRGKIIGGAIVLGLIVIAFWATGLGRKLVQQAKYAGRRATFSGDSQKLKQTVIVPTLDSPCPPGKNVIWCSSFQLAWNEVKDNVIHAPLQVIGAEEIAARLNAARQSSSDLDPKSFYVAGGWIKDGVVDKIRKDMAVKFPSHPLPDFNDYDDGILAYSYLNANVPFKYPFRQVHQGFTFTSSQGAKADVEAFGVWEAYQGRYKRMREQVQVLYCRSGTHPWEVVGYALDLCGYSQPYQLVVAVTEPRSSLAETIEHLRLQIDQYEKSGHHRTASQLGENEALRVPEMVWRIDHRFTELIGERLANIGGPITEAMETVEFRLDRSGATVESEALLATKAAALMHFVFDRPFLVYMQKRGAEQPFFVMWVDNAELLVRR